MKVAFLATIFPMNKKYLYDFFNSLQEQTYKSFEVIIINDGYESFDEIKTNYNRNLKIIELKHSNTPAKNREYGINYCIDNNYDILIFGDSDDYFAKNRVEKSIEFLRENDIVVNDLSLFNDNFPYEEKYLSNRIRNLQSIDFEFIKDKNIFGLSNTAIKLNNLKEINIPDNLIAVDWYFFTLLLYSLKKAIFTNETISYYRQYEENTVGIRELDEVSFQKALKVKKLHYDALKNKINGFDTKLKELSDIRFDNQEKINNPLWWELT